MSGPSANIRGKLDARSREVLDAVVRLHSETGRPVSSGLVSRFLTDSPSPATIRTVMKQLEQDGYLDQPHTSAGRLPTDTGFRVYVDGLATAWPLNRFDLPAGMVETVRRETDGSDPQSEIRELAKLLSLLTRNISIVVGPSADGIRVAHLECYPRSGRRVLMVMILDNGQVTTRLADLDADYPPAVVAKAAGLLVERLTGRSLGELRGERHPTLDLMRTPATRCAASLTRASLELMDEVEEAEVEMDGVAQVLEDPDFQDAEPLKALIRFLESPREIRAALQRMYLLDREPFGVWIGAENPLGSLRRFSVITGTIELAEGQGLLAVLGPRRLPYQRTFQGLEILRHFRGRPYRAAH